MKLNKLTPGQKTRLLAELQFKCICPPDCTDEACPICIADMDNPENWPHYLTNYDAIIILIQKLFGESDFRKFDLAYCKIMNIPFMDLSPALVFKATVPQLCDTVLVATRKAEL